MIRKIVQIDEELCNGCGACADACHENAIVMEDGKAKLVKDDYCDGLGDCLPACPAGAIQIIEREATAYDREAVEQRIRVKKAGEAGQKEASGKKNEGKADQRENVSAGVSQLRQWPVQIQLVPVQAPYFDGAQLLVAADCTAYAYGNFHQEFMKDRATVIGCPKLDDVDYAEKLTEILTKNDIRKILILRMEVPCCGGIEYAVTRAIENSGKDIPCETVIVGCNGALMV